MVDNKGSVVASPLPSGVSDATASLIESADRVDGSVILFDAQDNIVWVNERQRALMPCTDYVGETYSSLFWRALDKGLVGNPVAVSRPQMWLEFMILERASKRLGQSINRYAWGDMALTHRRFDDGSSIQIRFPTNGAEAENPERLLLEAVEARREAASLRHALDNLDIGVAMTDERGRLHHANASMHRILSQDLGLALSDARLIEPLHPADYHVWQSALALAASGYAPTVLMLPGGDDEPPLLAVSVVPGTHPRTVALLASPLRAGFGRSHVGGLSEAFAIPVEDSDILAKLASGQTLQEIAAQRRKETGGKVIAPFLPAAGVRRALRRHHLTTDNHAEIAAPVLRVTTITRMSLNQDDPATEE